ncbi:putative bifunctional diguanylate cyclase/phosphodiesterase [Pantoea agglomerans]|uniref:putative bifunctional diguanylate cyclase/phosphodiesterase n=1 Tax=Enterobacter agglomerans TaxID=549 RepID=UPI00045C4330|nr:EAL domain-containing protein [Pantoea agglomerans]KDA94822.1 diguanylate cyclase [Pantoea agglomerans Eh318]MBO0638009.1 EAL domain-containing protein [Pantoea agglomerans]MDK4216211.1 EAL domain-containing protein [Pantoea agglomerans]NQS79653.1 EAL domain-containing protein [Pantoea agglomerans]WAB85648.1 EAL domain-containing protein [Pantoea agglomerans]
MINTLKLSSDFRRSFLREVLVPLVAILLLTFVGAGAALFVGTSLTNTEARHQQQRMIEASFSQSLNEHLRQLHSLSRWGPFEQHLAEGNSSRWLDENIGLWLYEMFGHQLILVLDQQNQIVRVWREGQPVSAPEDDPLIGEVLQSPLVNDPARHDNADYARVTNRAAALAVGNIQRDDNALPRFRLVSLKFLDDGYLAGLAERNQLQGLHFSDGTPQPGTGARYLLIAQAGEAVGYLNWIPSRPGAQMLRTIGPSTGLAVLAISLLCLYMVRRLWNSSVNLSQSMLRLGASEAQAQHLAFHDVLTGLPNRALVEDRLTQALALATRHDQRVALLLIDLDRFKTINDTHGHHAGDELIIAVAQRLSRIVRASDTVGRIGGDEFIVVMPDVDNIGQVHSLAQRIIDELSEPFTLFGSDVWSGASIGLALAPKDGVDRLELMRKADIALYEAKSGGRGTYRQFERAMDESVRTRQTIAADLRTALHTHQGLEVWYQPLMDIGGQQMVGIEALLRWHHPARGLIAPGEFIAIAEETGLIIPLGEWVLAEACVTQQRFPELLVAVNVSPVQFRSTGFVERVMAIVSQNGGDPKRLELEITEGVLIEDEREARAIIVELRDAGFRIALDDFGTGYSSLNYLSNFPVDKIKIDRSFTQSLGVAENSVAIVESVVKLGHAMGLMVTAEGVETPGQMSALADAGCNQLQGYLFSQAVPADQLAALMKTIAPDNAQHE